MWFESLTTTKQHGSLFSNGPCKRWISARHFSARCKPTPYRHGWSHVKTSNENSYYRSCRHSQLNQINATNTHTKRNSGQILRSAPITYSVTLCTRCIVSCNLRRNCSYTTRSQKLSMSLRIIMQTVFMTYITRYHDVPRTYSEIHFFWTLCLHNLWTNWLNSKTEICCGLNI
jgi:hypothetical protein